LYQIPLLTTIKVVTNSGGGNMNNKFKIFSCFLLFFLSPLSNACIKANTIEDISLPEQKSEEGYFNPMSIPDAIDTFCTLSPIPNDLFPEAYNRLNTQKALLKDLFSLGLLSRAQNNYYKGFLGDVEKNLMSCEIEAKKMRRRRVLPGYDKLVDLTIRPNDIVDLYYKRSENGFPYKHIVSHKIWFGRIIRQDGFKLCQTKLKAN